MKVIDALGRLLTSASASILRETSGPTLLTMGSVADGTYFRRSGTSVTGVAAATQADMETATDTTTPVTPGRTQYHPGVAKAWGQVTYSGGTPTLNASYNVSGITDTSTGQLTWTIGTDFSSANYSIAGLVQRNSSNGEVLVPGIKAAASLGPTAGSFIQTAGRLDGALEDPIMMAMATYGDQ